MYQREEIIHHTKRGKTNYYYYYIVLMGGNSVEGKLMYTVVSALVLLSPWFFSMVIDPFLLLDTDIAQQTFLGFF